MLCTREQRQVGLRKAKGAYPAAVIPTPHDGAGAEAGGERERGRQADALLEQNGTASGATCRSEARDIQTPPQPQTRRWSVIAIRGGIPGGRKGAERTHPLGFFVDRQVIGTQR